eukprot:COSAG02_NODE_17768_length_982_cov_1.453001_1_plen_82_part_00
MALPYNLAVNCRAMDPTKFVANEDYAARFNTEVDIPALPECTVEKPRPKALSNGKGLGRAGKDLWRFWGVRFGLLVKQQGQ